MMQRPKLMTTSSESNYKPDKCPQCGYSEFIFLKPERGLGFFLLCFFGFILDLFTRFDLKFMGLEVMNKRHPGWMCKNCGWEQRVKVDKAPR